MFVLSTLSLKWIFFEYKFSCCAKASGRSYSYSISSMTTWKYSVFLCLCSLLLIVLELSLNNTFSFSCVYVCAYVFSSKNNLMIVFFSCFTFYCLFLLLNHLLFQHSSLTSYLFHVNHFGLKAHLSYLSHSSLKASRFLSLHHRFQGFIDNLLMIYLFFLILAHI